METLGCTLGNFVPLMLKILIKIYPSREEYLGGASSKLMLDHTNHLLESLLSLVPGMNKKSIKALFEDTVQGSLSQDYCS